MKVRQIRKDVGIGVALLSSLFIMMFGVVGLAGVAASAPAPAASHAVQDPAPNGDNGTTIDPLQYNCGNDAPTCGQVGESNGYYNGTNVDLLYSENYYCDANVSSAATTGCEVGSGPVGHAQRDLGRRLGDVAREHHPRRHALHSGAALRKSTGDPVHRPRPPASITRRPSTSPASPAALPGNPSRASVSNIPIPAHDHVVGHPEQRAARVVERPGHRHDRPGHLQHTDQRQRHQRGGGRRQRRSAPTNAFLFFQVLPGHLVIGHGREPDGDRSSGPAGGNSAGRHLRQARSSREPPSTT